MKVGRRILTAAFCLLAAALAGLASDGETVLRPSAVAVTVDGGGVRSVDTYLSPLRYQGAHVRIGFERLRTARYSPEWANQISAGLTYDNSDNPAHNNQLHTLSADVEWGLMHRWNLSQVQGLSVYVGGVLGFDGGVTYNPRNSNNVCSPLVHLHLGLTGMAVYRTRLGRLPLTLRYQATLPVVGCFFLPDYDQSFYEIYLGNYSDAVNFGWWGNRFDMDNLLTVDFHFGGTALRLGYRNEVTTLWENNISVRRTVHSAVLGVAWESIRIAPRQDLPQKVRMISAFY